LLPRVRRCAATLGYGMKHLRCNKPNQNVN
jgi:hypothetical protein